MSGYPTEYVDGGVLFQDTLESDVLGESTNFVNDEMWLGFGGRSWIETGQIGGWYSGCCALHRFWEYWIANKQEAGLIDPTAAPLKTYNHYEIYDPCHCGSWGIWWNGGNPAYEGTEVEEVGTVSKPIFPAYAKQLENGMEAASEVQPYNWGRSMVAAVVPPSDVWTEWMSGYGVHSHQHADPGQCVYRNPESGHWGNIEVSTCKCPKLEEGCSEHLAMIAPEESEPAIYEPTSGPLISSEAAAQIASGLANKAGDDAPTTEFTQVQTEFGTSANAITPGARMAENEATAAWRHSRSYLTVMHGRFEATPSKQGEAPFIGSVMAVVVDAHTGFIEGHYIGQSTPSATGLTPIAAPSARASAASTVNKGTVVGVLTRNRKPLMGWRIFYQGPIQKPLPGLPPAEKAPEPLTRTGRHGKFVVTLLPGAYRLNGVTPHGKHCQSKNVVVAAGRVSRVALACS